MKRKRRKRKRKWIRRGRAVGDFTSALVFSLVEGTIDFGIWSCKKIGSGISATCKQKKDKAVAKKSCIKQMVVVAKEPMFKPINVRDMENITFDDVVGLEEAKQQIKQRVILPFRHQDKARILKINKGGGVLLIGPLGVGKTMLAKAVANTVKAAFFHIKPSDIIRHSMGVSANRISELFRILRKYKVAVLFMDDVDGLVGSRSTNSVIMKSIITQYLVEIDGLERKLGDNVLLILAATNKPEVIDKAMKRYGRFDEKIFVGLPSIKARELILKKNLNGVPASDDIDFRRLAEMTELFSGVDLKGLVDKAKQRAFDRSIRLRGKKTVSQVSVEDFETVLRSFGPSINESDLSKYSVKI